MGVVRGVGGVVMDPYQGAIQDGFKGGCIGVFKGLGGLIGRPLKGTFDIIAQPLVGVVNTPSYIYKRLTSKLDPSSVKITNFKIFGIDDSASV